MNTKILFTLFLCFIGHAFAKELIQIDPTRNQIIQYNEKYDYWSLYLYKEKKRLCFPPAVAFSTASTSNDGVRLAFEKNQKDKSIYEILITLHVNSSVQDYIEKMRMDKSIRLVGEEVLDTYEIRHYGATFAKNLIKTLITITPSTYITTSVDETADGLFDTDWYKDMINGDLCRE